MLSADKPQYNFLYFNWQQFLALAIQEHRPNKKKPSTNSATKNKAPLLIIQGTDFNYTENTAFKNTFQTAMADRGVSEISKTSVMLQQCPLLVGVELCRKKISVLLKRLNSEFSLARNFEQTLIMEILKPSININNEIQPVSLYT